MCRGFGTGRFGVLLPMCLQLNSKSPTYSWAVVVVAVVVAVVVGTQLSPHGSAKLTAAVVQLTLCHREAMKIEVQLFC